jgi:hypothetical protein
MAADAASQVDVEARSLEGLGLAVVDLFEGVGTVCRQGNLDRANSRRRLLSKAASANHAELSADDLGAGIDSEMKLREHGSFS